MTDASFNDVRDLYQDVILRHGRRPEHMRRLEQFDATAKGDNPMCGDRVQVWVKFGMDETILATGFEARGCAISIASGDLMIEAVQGLDRNATKKLFSDFADMVRTGDCPACAALEKLKPLAGVHEYPSRVKCATLPWHALIAALAGTQETSSE